MKRLFALLYTMLFLWGSLDLAEAGQPKIPNKYSVSMGINIFSQITQNEKKPEGLLYYSRQAKIAFQETDGIYQHGRDRSLWLFIAFEDLEPERKYHFQCDVYNPAGDFVNSEGMNFVPENNIYHTWFFRMLESKKYGVLTSGTWQVKLYLNGYPLQTKRFQIRNSGSENQDELLRIKRLAEQGDDQARLRLGFWLMQGKNLEQDYQKAFQWFRLAADNSLPEAQYNLGIIYAKGLGREKSLEKAIQWLEKAASQGFLEAIENLGNLYAREKQYDKAYPYYKQGAEMGSALCQFNLGIMYSEGLEVPQDIHKAYSWYMQAVRSGNAGTINNLAMMHFEGNGVKKDEKTAVTWWLQAAEKGSMEAAHSLSLQYFSGQFVKKNVPLAIYWASRAAESGYAEAQFNLAIFCNRAFDSAEIEKSIYWYEKAAENQYPAAAYNLAVLHKTISPDNRPLYLKWLKIAAMDGLAIAQHDLAVVYRDGEDGAKADQSKALRWFAKAADQSFAPSLTNLGQIYMDGMGVPVNEKKAVNLFLEAARQEEPVAQLNLYRLYVSGKVLPRNIAEGMFWLKKASDNEEMNAQAALGINYFYGENVEQDTQQGISWLQKSAGNGCGSAQILLSTIYFSGEEGITPDPQKAMFYLRQAADSDVNGAKELLEEVKKELAQ